MKELHISNDKILYYRGEKAKLIKLLSEDPLDTIRKDPKNQNWESISFCLVLPEDFIREFKDYVHWSNICVQQNLSKEFISEFIDKINFKRIILNKNISKEVKDYCRMFL